MSGGSHEYMMGVISDKNGNPVSGMDKTYTSGFNGIYGKPGSSASAITELTTGVNFPDKKYYDLYKYDYELNTDIWYEYTNGKLGDATKEVAKTKENSSAGYKGLWYNDYASFPTISNPWFVRGGDYSSGANSGVLAFYRFGGPAFNYRSTRIVLAY